MKDVLNETFTCLGFMFVLLFVSPAIAALLVAVAFGLNLSVAGRSFPNYSLLSEENLVLAADTLRRAMEIYGN